jgi:preprotein translocase subunit Sec61beta
MKLNGSDAWKTWTIVIGLLIFTGVASAAWLWYSAQDDAQEETQTSAEEREIEPVTISVGDYVLGNDLLKIGFISENVEGFQINPWLVVGISAGVASLLVGAMGLGMTVITVVTSRQVTNVFEDESYQSSQAKLVQKDAEAITEKQGTRPVAASTGPERRLSWSVVTTTILILLLVWITGLIFGVAYFDDTTWEIAGLAINPVTFISLGLVILTIVVMALIIRSREPGELDSNKTDNNPVNWNYVWIILSGAVIFGLGAGLAFAMSSLPAG